jgi:hypothetical protein
MTAATDDPISEFRKLLQDLETKGWARFDDLLFKVSAGGLALSLTLVGVLRDFGPTGLPWMFGAWSFWALTILLLLISLQTGQYGLRSQIAHLDAGTYYQVKRPEGIGVLTPWLNHLATASCGGALLCLVVFAGVNISGGPMAGTNLRTGGNVSPQAPASTVQTGGMEHRGQVAPQAPALAQPTSVTITVPGGAGQVAPQAPQTPPPVAPPSNEG